MRVLISGAGIAGPALAFWLNQYGHSAVIVERSPCFRTGGYLIDFWGLGYDIVEKMGLKPKLDEAGHRVLELRMVDQNGNRKGGFSFDPMYEALNERLTSLPRSSLAKIIYDSIESKMEKYFGDSIKSIEEKDEGVLVTFEKHEAEMFDLVVGADGLHSNVRKLTFDKEKIEQRYLGAKVAAIQVDDYPLQDELVYIMANEPGRSVSRVTLNQEKTLLFFIYCDENEEVPHSLEGKLNELQRLFGQDGEETNGKEFKYALEALAALSTSADSEESLYLDAVCQIRSPTWKHGKRVVLIGDAAGCPSLLAGEGAGLGIIEAYFLAGELHLATSSPDWSSCSLVEQGNRIEAALSSFESKLHKFVTDKQDTAISNLPFFVPKSRLGLFIRNIGSRLMSIPFVNKLMMSQFVDKLDVPDYQTLASNGSD